MSSQRVAGLISFTAQQDWLMFGWYVCRNEMIDWAHLNIPLSIVGAVNVHILNAVREKGCDWLIIWLWPAAPLSYLNDVLLFEVATESVHYSQWKMDSAKLQNSYSYLWPRWCRSLLQSSMPTVFSQMIRSLWNLALCHYAKSQICGFVFIFIQ